MFSITLLCVGNLKEEYWRDACAEYEKRLSRWCRLRIVEISEERLPDHPGDAQINEALNIEAGRIIAGIPARSYVSALCIEGRAMSSTQFAGQLSGLMTNGFSSAAFIIGSSFGLSPSVKRKADFSFSISQMTFPHQLARVMLLEQLYRAFSINNGGKYNK